MIVPAKPVMRRVRPVQAVEVIQKIASQRIDNDYALALAAFMQAFEIVDTHRSKDKNSGRNGGRRHTVSMDKRAARKARNRARTR